MASRFVVAFLPSEEINSLINPTRDQFEPGVSGKVIAHISLSYPFRPKNNTDDLIATVGTISKNYQPFTATVNDVNSFPKANGKKVVHLRIGPAEKLVEINQTLDRVLCDFIDYDASFFPDKKLPPYDPHLTVALDATPEQETTAKGLLQPVVTKEFNVDAFYLLENPEQSLTWKIFQKFPLG